jgi:hypothetical protein
MNKRQEITQYYSKWKKCWVYFMDSLGNKYMPNEAEIKEFIRFKYLLK